jgi:DNA-directed RNA polymerase specialized sigma24 family protein
MTIAENRPGPSRDQLLRAIMKSLQSWPDLHRRIFIDIHYGGRSAAEIADVLGLPLSEIDRILELCSANLNHALKAFRQTAAGGISEISFHEPVHAATCCCR